MPKGTKDADETAAKEPTFSDVQRELTKRLGPPRKLRGVFRYPAPRSAMQVAKLVDRVHAAGGAASLAEAYPARLLCVADGPPSLLMDLVTWVRWRSKAAAKALELLDADAGVRIANINYTGFIVELERVPKDCVAHAKRLAKIVFQGDAKKIEAALKRRRWET